MHSYDPEHLPKLAMSDTTTQRRHCSSFVNCCLLFEPVCFVTLSPRFVYIHREKNPDMKLSTSI